MQVFSGFKRGVEKGAPKIYRYICSGITGEKDFKMGPYIICLDVVAHLKAKSCAIAALLKPARMVNIRLDTYLCQIVWRFLGEDDLIIQGRNGNFDNQNSIIDIVNYLIA